MPLSLPNDFNSFSIMYTSSINYSINNLCILFPFRKIFTWGYVLVNDDFVIN